jgi:dTDP-4-dehydrorhamnose 3,5-epimerase
MKFSWNKKPYFADDRGWSIFDIFGGSDIQGQVNISRIDAGVVKAFHLHRRQDDYVICIEGKCKLIVANEDWTGLQQVVLDERNPGVFHIPAGSWHGYKGLDSGAKILYYCSNKYDGGNPDEERAPWDSYGKEIWDIEFK